MIEQLPIDLAAAYPQARCLVEWCEASSWFQEIFLLLTRASKRSPSHVRDGALHLLPLRSCPRCCCDQANSVDFLRYVTAKLGAL